MLTQLKLLLGITDNNTDSLLNLLLKIAEDLALRTLNPFEEDIDSLVLPYKYNYLVVQMAKNMHDSLGSEIVKSYSENGLSISYRDLQNGVSKELLNQLIPKAKALM